MALRTQCNHMARRALMVATGRRGFPVRFHSSSTMSLGSPNSQPASEASTIGHGEKKDFSTAATSDTTLDFDTEHWNALLSASSNRNEKSVRVASARRLDLTDAAACKHQYDKVLLLVRHGHVDDGVDPLLSGRGVGQVLNLSRRTATFCNEETGLVPELVVSSPLKRAIQTALFIFPQYSPAATLRPVTWVCHGELMEQARDAMDIVSPKKELQQCFPGIDFELIEDSSSFRVHERAIAELPLESLMLSKLDLIDRSDRFVDWIRKKEERVIVVSSHSTWFQSLLGHSLRYDDEQTSENEMLKPGDIRAVGVNFE